MFVFRDPMLNVCLRTLLEADVIRSQGVACDDGDVTYYLVLPDGQFETTSYSEFRRKVQAMYEGYSRRELKVNGSKKARSESFIAAAVERGYDELLVRSVSVALERFGHHDEIYLSPLLEALSDVSASTRNLSPKDLVSLICKNDVGRVEKRNPPDDYRTLSVLVFDERHPLVRIGRDYLNVERRTNGKPTRKRATT